MSKAEITVGQLKEKLDEVQLIDVREASEFDEGHISGAKNIPMANLESQIDQLDSDKTVHVICRTGNRSAKACAMLEEHGIDAVNVKGGMLAWEEEA